MVLKTFLLGLLKRGSEGLDAASGGIILRLFEKYIGQMKQEEVKEFYKNFVRRGILPFGFSKEDEAKLILRFRKTEGGLTPEEAVAISSFLATRCTVKERASFRYTIATIDEIPKVARTVYEDKAKKKTRTVEKTKISDPGLDFLKMLADRSFDDEKRYTICKGLGLFDFSHNIEKTRDYLVSASGKVDETLLTLAFKMRNSLLPAPQPRLSSWSSRLNPKNLF